MYSTSKDRLQYLSTLKKGWLDEDKGAGAPVSENIIGRSREALLHFDTHAIPEPLLFPTEEGYILIEWHLDDGIVTIDVEPTTYYLFALDTTKTFGKDRYTHKEDVYSIDEVIEFVKEKVGTS